MFKKIISSTLILSLFSLNTCVLSKANTEILNRYETLEGEFIDLGDTDSKDIAEIEIFGNTVQNPDNLENIQSVGDLYINEEGEPILDLQGRQQYKIEIESCNKNLSSLIIPDNTITGYEYLGDGKFQVNSFHGYIGFISRKLQKNTQYTLSFESSKVSNTWISIKVGEQIIESANKNTVKFTTDETGIIGIRGGAPGYIFDNTATIWNIQLEKGTAPTTYVKSKLNKTTVLLPCQLMRIGNIKDRLFWDDEKMKYVVEKNIICTNLYNLIDGKFNQNGFDESNINGFVSISSSSLNSNYNYLNSMSIKENLICNKLPIIREDKNNVKESIMVSGVWTTIILSKDKTNSTNFSDIKNYICNNDYNIYIPLETKSLIETNITSKMKIPTYLDKTYIYTKSENGITPTLKVVVDKIEEVSQEAVENALTNTTSSNIALARMLVNMLPESLYKDQLQAQLNEIFSEDMVLEKQSATANLDVYVKSENILMMSLDTNTITFEDYSGVEDLEILDAINISINSSLPYSLNAYIVGDITNKDKDKALDLDILNIRDSSATEYKKFESINNKLVLKDNCSKGNNISHNIDLKLSGNNAHDADVYKTTVKFEAEQK